MRLLVISDIHGNWPVLQAIEVEATVAGIEGVDLADDAAEDLISMLRTGKPCTTVAPERRVERVR